MITSLVASALLLYQSLFPPTRFHMANGASKFISGTFLAFILPFFLLGFGIFGLLRQLFFKLRLDNEKSIGREFMPKEMIIGNTIDEENE